jgi:hypothetical protein
MEDTIGSLEVPPARGGTTYVLCHLARGHISISNIDSLEHHIRRSPNTLRQLELRYVFCMLQKQQ